MKPTQEEKEWLQNYLHNVLKYRETYEEVYDHILTALADRPEGDYFEGTVREIVTGDLGGIYGLLAMERNCKNAAAQQVIKQYWSYFYGFLKFPQIAFTITLLLMMFYSSASILMVFKLVVVTVPHFILYSVIWFKTSHKFNSSKASLKDKVFRKLIFKPVMYYLVAQLITLLFVQIFLPRYVHIRVDVMVDYCASALISTASCINFICCYKLYKDAFKVNIAVS